MTAVDPTYPLYPVACVLSSALLLLTLSTRLVHQSWNLGVTFLCFWLFWENLTGGINAVIWSDNYDVKLYVYCDIVTHLDVITFAVKPMCTLIILRRLHLIVNLCSVEPSSTREKRNNLILEWTLGLVVPLIVAGPFYSIVQPYRFEIEEGFGCRDNADFTILSQLLLTTWSFVPPLISTTIYYPKIIWTFYRQRRDINHFLHSNNSISRTNYFRILTLASIDILFTLPSGIAGFVISAVQANEHYDGHVPFYRGWSSDHHSWAPVGFSYMDLKLQGPAALLQHYFTHWTSPALAIFIFGLFGLTAEARTTYCRAIYFVGNWFCWKPATRKSGERPVLGPMEFSAQSQVISLDAELGSRPSFVNFDLDVAINAHNVTRLYA